MRPSPETQRKPFMTLSRRTFMQGAAVGAAALTLPRTLAANESMTPLHGFSKYGDLYYPADFAFFDYVNAAAPKGGKMVTSAVNWNYNQDQLSFNSFNTFIFKGNAPVKMHQFCYDSLMVASADEPDSYYGLVAESIEMDKAARTAYFNLRPEAKFSDNSSITAHDVAFSLMTFKDKGHPQIRQLFTQLVNAEAVTDTRLKVTFEGNNLIDAITNVAGMQIISKAYYEAHDFEESSLTVPITSGPYTIGNFEPGRFIEYVRRPDYWGWHVPAMQGSFNFDVIRYEFYQDSQVLFEAFKKGEVSFYQDYSSKNWATGYDFPAFNNGDVIRRTFPNDGPAGVQAWYINNRLEKFADPRVREAIGLLFDFEWTNENLFYGLYTRRHGFFEGGALKAEGEPSEAQLALLEPFRDQLDPRVFGPPIMAPTSDGSGRDRSMLRKAMQLFQEAGFKREGNVLHDPQGNPFTIEFLDNSPGFERIVLPITNTMKSLGIEAVFRLVDPSQYVTRIDDFDFEITSRAFFYGDTMTDALKDQWHSDFATIKGSTNIAGISSPVVDHLLETAIKATTRKDMQEASRAMDRVLRSGFHVIPAWRKDIETVAFWDVFGFEEIPPKYGFEPEFWWWAKEIDT